jgi:hypothetical protein
MPGDWIWMKNPYFDGTVGEEGSNAIYAGGGWFVSYDGSAVRDFEQLQRYVRGFESAPDSAPLRDFRIRRIYRPTVPDFCK